jgi:hypothetical protein
MSLIGRGMVVLALAGAQLALAQDRPDEGALFGAPASTDAGNPTPGAPFRPTEDSLFDSTPRPAATDAGRDVQELSASNPERNAFASGESVENPLQIGGVFYQRGYLSGENGVSPNHTPYSLPLQVNGYMDARPNDRVRGFVLARLQYDPTLDPCSASTAAPIVNATAPCPRAIAATTTTAGGNSQLSSGSSAPTSFGTGTPLPSNPAVLLDQAWLKFDIERVVFVTVGKQHVKWGASHFWNPTDFLHTQIRDPLLPYDLRTGNSMVKFEVPLEASATNFYGALLFDNPQPASAIGQLGGAFRAETLLGNTALGAEAVLRNGDHPVIGADISTPLGPIDVYAEGAYRERPDVPLYSLNLPPGLPPSINASTLSSLLNGGPSPNFQAVVQQFCQSNPSSPYCAAGAGGAYGLDVAHLFSGSTPAGQYVQVSGGATYDFAWKENRQATLNAEYFFNRLGYSNSLYYPVLIFNGTFTPFYTGRHYAALALTAEGPDELKHTSYVFTTIGNLSDMSFISRVDFTWRVLTYLTFQLYADVHYGNQGGEFRFSINTPTFGFNGSLIPPISVPPPTFDLGFGLRIAI